MILAYHGRRVSIGDLAVALHTGRDGVSADALIDAAAEYGLLAQGVRVGRGSVRMIPCPAILFLANHHFAVLESHEDEGVSIVDPAIGRTRLTNDELAALLTGVALVFERQPAFMPGRPAGAEHLLGGALVRHWGLGALVVVLSMTLPALGLVVPILTGQLIDRALTHRAPVTILPLAALFAATLGAYGAAMLGRALLTMMLQQRLDIVLSRHFVRRLLALPFTLVEGRPASDSYARYGSNLAIREIAAQHLSTALVDVLTLLVYGGMLVRANLVIAAAVLALGGLHMVLTGAALRLSLPLSREHVQVDGRHHAALLELCETLATTKAMGGESAALRRWWRRFVDTRRSDVRRQRVNGVFEASTAALAMAAVPVIALAGSTQLGPRLSVGQLFGYTALATLCLAPLTSLLNAVRRAGELIMHVHRVNEILYSTPEHGRTPGVRRSLVGDIVFQNVTFRHGGCRTPILDGVSLTIEAGTFVGIVGKSGSGKSTLAKLMLGLYKAAEGAVLIDGTPVEALDLVHFRRQAAALFQGNALLEDTIGANIEFGGHGLSEAQMREAARKAHIDADIAQMPFGYRTMLATNGAGLSGGQQQRIALARALARQPRLLILDEATNALDSATEHQIMREIERLPCTRVVVTHRVAALAAADLIVVLENGRVAASGSHDELLMGCPVYRGLVADARTDSRSAPLRAVAVV